MKTPAPPAAVRLQRVLVVGISGAGKSTLARSIAAARDLPYVELDDLFWGPGWEPKPSCEFKALVAQAIAGERWVVDGNYSAVRETLWPQAQAVVWLNVPRRTALWRVFWRCLRRIAAGTRLRHGNRETVGRTFFSRESILGWVWTAHGRRRAEFEALRATHAFPELVWIELRQSHQVREFLRTLHDDGSNFIERTDGNRPDRDHPRPGR